MHPSVLPFFALLCIIAARRCPIGYTLYSNGDCMRLLTVAHYDRADVITEKTRVECQKDGAYPPIIHFNHTNTQLYNIFASGIGTDHIVLGLVCDPTTNTFLWADGSPVDYWPSIDGITPCFGRTVFMGSGGAWHENSTEYAYWTSLCVKPFSSQMDAVCFDYERFTSPEGNFSSCYKVSPDSMPWSIAQSECNDDFASLVSIHDKEENEFVRELSISKGYYTGIHLGANRTGKDSNKYGWVDGTKMDYKNFYAGFPMEDMGDCTAMDISSGKWMNDECLTKLPFVCKRDPEKLTPECGTHTYKPGEIVTPPGFPRTASEPCDYFLKVDTGKIVELEILFLEANACCDHLLIFNGQFEEEPFAVLTGSDREGEIFRTTSTVNIMRVKWLPQRAESVRGFAMTFRAV